MTTLSTYSDNTESTTENRPTMTTITDMNTPEQLNTSKETDVVTTTTQPNNAVTRVKASTQTITESNDMTSQLSTVSVTGIEARTESDDNIITDNSPINLDPTTFTNAPRTTGTTIPGTSTETTLTTSTSGTTSYITEKLPTEIIKDTTVSKVIKEITTNIPYTASNDGTEFITQNTVSYTDTGSKNYSTTLDSDELVQSSSTIHVESTEKPYIKHNDSTESSTLSTESKNTKNPENQRQLNNNYTETTQTIKLNTLSIHTTPDIDVTTSSKLYTTVPVITTESAQVVTSQLSKLTTKNEIDTETVVGNTTGNIITSTQSLETNTTEVVTANNLEITSSTESKTGLRESMSTPLPSTIVYELGKASTQSDTVSTLQSDENAETITDNTQAHNIDATTGTTDSHIENLATENEFSVATTMKAKFTFDETLQTQTNSILTSTTSTVEVTGTEQTESTKSTNEENFRENEGTTLFDIITKKDREVTTELHKNDRTDYTTKSTRFTHNYVGTTSELSDFTTTDTSMFKSTTDAQFVTKFSIKPMSDSITTDSETATTVLKEVTGITSTDRMVQTSYDIKLDTSTPTYTSQTEISNTITDTSHEMSTKTYKDDITTNTLKGPDKKAGLDSMVTTENVIEARTKTSTSDDTTTALRDIIATGSTSSTFNLEKTTETRKDAVTTSRYSDSLKKVTEFFNTEMDTTEKEIVNQQSSSLWEDIQTTSQKTTIQTHDFEDIFSTKNNKETTTNIKDTVPFTTSTTQLQFSTHPDYDGHIITMSSQQKTTENISDSSTSNSFTNTVLIEATTSTITLSKNSSQEEATKLYEISTPSVMETREYTDNDYISTMKEEVSASTTTRQDTSTRDNFAQSTTSHESQYSTATTDFYTVSDKSSFDQSDKMFTPEISQTTPEVLETTSTANDKSIQILGSTSDTITTHSPESKHDNVTESKEVVTSDVSTSNIIVTESYPTNTVIIATSQNIDDESTTLKLNENTENVSSIITSTISSDSYTMKIHSDTTDEPTASSRISIESTTEQFYASQPLGQETDTTAATHTTSVSIDTNMSHDMDYTGIQFEPTVDNIIIMTPSTSTTNNYNASITEATTNIQEVTSETEMFITTTKYESKPQATFTPSMTTKNTYNASITETSTNTQEITPETEMFITTTQSESQPQASTTVHYSPVTSTPTTTQSFDKTESFITITEHIEISPDTSTSTENMSSRQRENVDISAWTDSTSTTDLTSTESGVQTTETVTNLKQCEVNSQCSEDKACLNGVCQNPCETARSVCTKSVACKVVNHTAVCVCDDAAGVYCVRGMHFLFAYQSYLSFFFICKCS